MSNFIILIGCFLMGIILRKTGRLQAGSVSTLNAYILNVALPAQILYYIHSIEISANLIFPILVPWIIFIIGFGLFYFMSKFLSMPKDVMACLMLVAGLGNTSFIGLPMIETYFGKEFLAIGILVDQPGTFLALSFLGIPIALLYSNGSLNRTEILKKIFFFPPFQVLVLAFLLRPVPYPEFVNKSLIRVGDTLAPIALLSVGFQFQVSEIKDNLKYILIGLSYKMIIAPIIILGLYIFLLQNRTDTIKVAIFEAAMPPMITAGIVAVEHGLSPQLASLTVAIGILSSFISLYFWHGYLIGL